MSNIEKIRALRAELYKLVSEWQPNQNVPPNYIREDGLGTQVAIVDVSCGGYQWPHTPTVVGWRVCRGSHRTSGVVVVRNPHDKGSVMDAILEAKAKADTAYIGVFGREPPGRVEVADPEPPDDDLACDGCGCESGDGRTSGCEDPDGCGREADPFGLGTS